jgi:hypothetical protein
MPSLKNLVSEVRDPNDYDGAVVIALKDGGVANFMFTGGLPQGIDQRKYIYSKLMEAAFALAFMSSKPSEGEGNSSSN